MGKITRRTTAAGIGIAVILSLGPYVADAAVTSPAGGSSNTTPGIDPARGCVYAGFDYRPSGTDLAAGPLCYTTPDNSTIPRLAAVNPTKTAAQLTSVQTSSPLAPSTYLAGNTMATRDIRTAPRLANSAEIASFVQNLPARYLPAQFASWLRTSINVGGGIGGNDNIPIYVADSSNPFQTLATFSTTDTRVTSFPKLLAITSGPVPVPTWAVPSTGGDHALAILDKGTGIMRGYFGVTKVTATSFTYANASYLYTDGSNVTPDNYWLGYIQGSNSVVGIANELTQIGAAEVANGSINHMVSVTFPSAKAGVISFPAKASDGRLTEAAAPAEGQVFTLPADLDIDALGLSPLSKMIAKAVQRYGGIISDQNYWTMAFNLESPLGAGPGAPNPWATGGAAHSALGGNLGVNDFPWWRTEWLPVGYAGRVCATPADTVAPVASMVPLAAAHLRLDIPVSWAATDQGGSGVAIYDVRYRKALLGSGFGAFIYPTAQQSTTTTSTTLTGEQGSEYCVSARATDAAGNVGAWTTETCTAVALDDRAMSRTGEWTLNSSAVHAFGTSVETRELGASLQTASVSTKRLGLVVTTQDEGGYVRVSIGQTYVGRIAMVSDKTRHQRVHWLPLLPQTLTGPVTITTTSTWRVIIDGMVVQHQR
ncbi:MAG: hypothetical protein IPL43_08925 [Micropruina sp.]|nr:hypothetical protein [Micropruina sp.]